MMEQETEFKRWRRETGLTQEQAAAALGVSESQIKNWDAGVDRSRGTPIVPGLVVRMVMAEIAKGRTIEPWPAEPAKRRGSKR